jgi:hypothetical protein
MINLVIYKHVHEKISFITISIAAIFIWNGLERKSVKLTT